MNAVAGFFNVGASAEVEDYVFVETPVGTAFSGGALGDPSGMFFAGLISEEPFTTATFGCTPAAPTGWNFDNMHRAPAGDQLAYEFSLSGCKEVGQVITTGNGEAAVTVDPATGAVSVIGTYSDMSSDVSAAHIHGPANKDQNAGVILTLETTGGTDGDISGNGILTDEQIGFIMDGLTYVNVHSADHGGGEIRGQIENECRGDVNGDGMKNILDFVAFQGLFVKQACEADVNHDLVYNILDFVAFQAIFQEACD